MSTITSPRPSTPSLQTPASSRRTSTDTTRSRGVSPAAPTPQPHQRRGNRAALRDYYGLKAAPATAAAAAAGSTTPLGPSSRSVDDAEIKESELDREGFDAKKYVADVLSKEGLEGVLKLEAGLIGEIRGLDGERKALVYDNYSKLITATDTIRKMRMNMDPLTPTTSTLRPAISHIAETAASLSESLQARTISAQETGRRASTGADPKSKQRQLVRWVLEAPRRLDAMLQQGKGDEVEVQWKKVSQLLDRWKGVDGVEDVRRQCEQVLAAKSTHTAI